MDQRENWEIAERRVQWELLDRLEHLALWAPLDHVVNEDVKDHLDRLGFVESMELLDRRDNQDQSAKRDLLDSRELPATRVTWADKVQKVAKDRRGHVENRVDRDNPANLD